MSISRPAIIRSFDAVRPTFLAALDQVVAEVRPRLREDPSRYSESVRACAEAFANPDMVHQQLAALRPDLTHRLHDHDIVAAHLTAVSYLLSLTLHELISANTDPSTDQELPL